MKLALKIKFAGGLGNQLFQYATARSICLKNRIPFLFFDTDDYLNESQGRTFCLMQLNVKGNLVKSRHGKNIFKKHTKLNRLAAAVKLHNHIEENGFVLQNIKTSSGVFTTLKGYWQSADYFNDIRSLLLDELLPLKIPAYPAWVAQVETVAIHVRRTDYLNEHRYGFLGAAYYHAAIKYLQSRIQNPLFVFFSDDMEWCRQEFTKQNNLFCEEKNWDADWLQLHLMSKCKHQVIANSSFSWWGAWLNNNPDKMVVRPLNPFREKVLLYESHYPQEWVAIEN